MIMFDNKYRAAYISWSGFKCCILAISVLQTWPKNGFLHSEKQSMMLLGFSIGIQALSCQDNMVVSNIYNTENKILKNIHLHTIRMKISNTCQWITYGVWNYFLETVIASALYHKSKNFILNPFIRNTSHSGW